MTILGLTFLIFVLLVWAAAQAARTPRARTYLLLVASAVFYATWGWHAFAVLAFSVCMNFFLLRAVRRKPTSTRLWVGLAANLVLLAVFKYWQPHNTAAGAHAFTSLIAQWGIPIGVSFWTFQALSSLLDVYKGEELDPTFAEYALYLSFWPTVLSGPVCRLPDMLPQFRNPARTNASDVAEGVRRIVFGLFMKLFLARVLASGILPEQGLNIGFDQLSRGWSGLDVWVLAIGYGFQLYFDFAGYSHIVIGVARLFGLQIPENFSDPYLATTPSVFWTRWHMSLSFWIRDYLFFPLATLRREIWWRNLALAASMIIFGLWHGAAWGYLVWGAYQGLLLVLHRQWQSIWRKLSPGGGGPVAGFTGWAVNMAAICLGWLPFRCHTLHETWRMCRALVTPAHYFRLGLDPGLYINTFFMVSGYFAFVGLRKLYSRLVSRPAFRTWVWLVSPAYYALLLTVIILWSSQKTVFVYLKF